MARNIALRGVQLGHREPNLMLLQTSTRKHEPAEVQMWGKAAGGTPELIAGTEFWETRTTIVEIPINGTIMKVVAKVQEYFHLSEAQMHSCGLMEDGRPSPLGCYVRLTTFILEVTFPANFYVKIILEETARNDQPHEAKINFKSRFSLDSVVSLEEATSLIRDEIDGEFVLAQGAEVQPEFKTLAFPLVSANKEDKPRKQRMTVEQANAVGKRLFKQMGVFRIISERRQAKLVGCSWATWKKTPICVALTKRRKKLFPKNLTAAQSPEVIGDADLARLTSSQQDDNELSPLDDSPERFTRPSAAGRRVVRSKQDSE